MSNQQHKEEPSEEEKTREGGEKSATGFNEDLCQQNNTATLQTDPRRLSNIIHNLGIVHKWLLDFVVAVVILGIMLFRVLDENQTRATVQGGFFRGRTGSFYLANCRILPQVSNRVMSSLETFVGGVTNLF